MAQGPVEFDNQKSKTAEEINVELAPMIDAETTAMGVLTTRTGRRTGWLGRLFMTALTTFLILMISLWFWDFATSLLARNQLLGQIALGLLVVIIIVMVLYIIRELWAMSRLRRVDKLREEVHETRISGNLKDAQKHCKQIVSFYKRNPLVDHQKWDDGHKDILDAEALLEFTEIQILEPLDQEARREIEKRARQVAVVTAFVPLALADLIVVLSANIGMIRRIADIYGGRPGVVGGWRLFRKVATHLVATGAVAVGDDLIGSVVGGNMLGKLSRRFGEGVINAALSARVGIAAIEVCRPMEFDALKAPSVGGSISRSLGGFMPKGEKGDGE